MNEPNIFTNCHLFSMYEINHTLCPISGLHTMWCCKQIKSWYSCYRWDFLIVNILFFLFRLLLHRLCYIYPLAILSHFPSKTNILHTCALLMCVHVLRVITTLGCCTWIPLSKLGTGHSYCHVKMDLHYITQRKQVKLSMPCGYVG